MPYIGKFSLCRYQAVFFGSAELQHLTSPASIEIQLNYSLSAGNCLRTNIVLSKKKTKQAKNAQKHLAFSFPTMTKSRKKTWAI